VLTRGLGVKGGEAEKGERVERRLRGEIGASGFWPARGYPSIVSETWLLCWAHWFWLQMGWAWMGSMECCKCSSEAASYEGGLEFTAVMVKSLH